MPQGWRYRCARAGDGVAQDVRQNAVTIRSEGSRLVVKLLLPTAAPPSQSFQ